MARVIDHGYDGHVQVDTHRVDIGKAQEAQEAENVTRFGEATVIWN